MTKSYNCKFLKYVDNKIFGVLDHRYSKWNVGKLNFSTVESVVTRKLITLIWHKSFQEIFYVI